ncbi:MAG: hypothetical protein ACRDSR_02635 [Pseudonocardiaceae bacterium]
MTPEPEYDATIPTPVDAVDDTTQPGCGYPVDRTHDDWPGEAAPPKEND